MIPPELVAERINFVILPNGECNGDLPYSIEDQYI